MSTSNGVVFTVTQIVHNPGGDLNSSSGGSNGSTSAFFNNKGAVAGVFVVVGLAVFGILAALGLLCFRRRRRQRLDREVTAAAIAASGGHTGRSVLDEQDDMDHPSSSAHHTAGSYPSTVNSPMQQYNSYGATYGQAGGYDPYAAQQQPLGHASSSSYDYGYNGSSGSGLGLPAGAAGAAAGAGAVGGYHAVTSNNEDPYYFDPRDVSKYEDETPGVGAGGQEYYQGGYSDDPYGGYSDGQGYEGSTGTPGSERTNPLHVSGGLIYASWHSMGDCFFERAKQGEGGKAGVSVLIIRDVVDVADVLKLISFQVANPSRH